MPIKRRHLGGAAAAAALLYALWPATPAPAPPAPDDRSDHYFDFVRPTESAPAPPPPTATPTPARPADAAAPTAALPASLHAQVLAVQTLRRQGGDANAVYRLRAATLGAPLAARLAEMDDAEARWRSRLDAYQAERAHLAAGAPAAAPADIEAGAGADVGVGVGARAGAGTGAAGAAALARLRSEHFAADEQAMLDANLPSEQREPTQD